MNVKNQTILHIKAGHLPPKDMLEFLVAQKPNSIGWIVQEADGKPLDVLQQKMEQTVDDIEGFLEGAKDQHKTLYFGKLEDGVSSEDIQPFVIDDNDSHPFLAMMLEGDIVGHDAKGHTEQFNYTDKVLIPELLEMCSDFDGDIEKVMAKLNKDSFKNNFFMHVGHRAVLHFMPFKGEPLMIAKNDLHKSFDWGWVSQAIGYGEKAVEVAAPAASKRTWGKKSTVREPASTAKANADKPVLSVVPKVEQKKEAPTILESTPVRPPSWLHTNQDIRAFYEILTGAIPSNWKKKIPVVVTQNYDLLKVTNIEEFKQYRLGMALKTTGQTKQERLTTSAAPKASSVTPPPLPTEIKTEPMEPIHGPVDNTPLPIIEPKDLQKVLDLVATLDHNSKEMMDPKELQKVETELPKFTEQVGLKGIEETMNWKVSDLFAIAATDARALVMLLVQWRAYARPYLQAELKAKAKDNVQTTTEKLTPNTTKVESVARPTGSRKWGKRAA